MDELIPEDEIKDIIKPELVKGEIVLTDNQWAKVVEIWNREPENPPTLTALAKEVFNNNKLDGRCKEGRAIKRRMRKENMQLGRFNVPKKKMELTPEQREYVENHYETETAEEMARMLFQNNTLTFRNTQTRAVLDYIDRNKLKKKPTAYDDIHEDVARVDYNPPADQGRLIARVNKWVKNINIDKEKLSKKQEKDLDKLRGYLDGFRFRYQINSYDKISYRELFESSFIRYTYDKPDLTEEEVDQYISLCGEIVMGGSLLRMSERLETHLDSRSNQEDPKIHMGLVEAVNAARKEYNQCILRQEKLLNALKQKRSEKDLKKKDSSASISNLVECWKDEDTRLKMIKIAEKRRMSVMETFDSLDNMEDLKAKILGITREDMFS